MNRVHYYSDIDGNEVEHIALQPISAGLFGRTRLKLHRLVIYHHPLGRVVCRPGTYDGYSVPKWVSILTFGVMRPFMPVVECTLPHDVVCALGMFTEEQRTVIFKDAYDDAVAQFYGGEAPDRRRDQLIAGVYVGSKYLGQC